MPPKPRPYFLKREQGLGAVVVTEQRVEPAARNALVTAGIAKLKPVIEAAGKCVDGRARRLFLCLRNLIRPVQSHTGHVHGDTQNRATGRFSAVQPFAIRAAKREVGQGGA